MPTYVYKFVDTGETIEVVQSFTDDTLTEAVHPASGESLPVKKVFQPVGVTFKGDGFYKNDSRKSSSGASGSSDSSSTPSSTPSSSSSSSGSSGAPSTNGAATSSSTSGTTTSTATSTD